MMNVDKHYHDETNAGMTLIEVLASVVVLALFITVMLSLFAQSSTVSHQSGEKRQAMILAQNMLANMSSTSATSVISQGPQTVNSSNRVTYTVTPSSVLLPGPGPHWTDGGVYAEVTVSWSSFQDGRKVTESIEVEQFFPK